MRTLNCKNLIKKEVIKSEHPTCMHADYHLEISLNLPWGCTFDELKSIILFILGSADALAWTENQSRITDFEVCVSVQIIISRVCAIKTVAWGRLCKCMHK